MALPPEREALARIDPAGYLAQFNVLPYLVAVADEVLDLGIEPITPAQLTRAASRAIRKIPVHALEAAVVSMAMLGEGLVKTDAARTLIRQHLAAIGEALEANDREVMGGAYGKPVVNLDQGKG
jgi:hypothetical protein